MKYPLLVAASLLSGIVPTFAAQVNTDTTWTESWSKNEDLAIGSANGATNNITLTVSGSGVGITHGTGRVIRLGASYANAAGSLIIKDEAFLAACTLFVGGYGGQASGPNTTGTLTLDGTTGTSSNSLRIASSAGSVGTINLLNGAQFTANVSATQIGEGAGATAIINISDASILQLNTHLYQGMNSGTSTINISGEGSQMNVSKSAAIGQFAEHTATINLTNKGAMTVGYSAVLGAKDSATGIINISSGATLTQTSERSDAGSPDPTMFVIARNENSVGTLTIDGAGSTLNVQHLDIVIARGNNTQGTMTLKNGGAASIGEGNLILNDGGVGTAVLNFGDYNTPSTTGTLAVGVIESRAANGTGSATINFNQTDELTLASDITSEIKNGLTLVQRGTGTTILTGKVDENVNINVEAGTLKTTDTVKGQITISDNASVVIADAAKLFFSFDAESAISDTDGADAENAYAGGDKISFENQVTIYVSLKNAANLTTNGTYYYNIFKGANLAKEKVSIVLPTSTNHYWEYIGNGQLTLTVTTVPEPQTYALFGGIALLGMTIIRRRRNKK